MSGYVHKMNATRFSNCEIGDDCCTIEKSALFIFQEKVTSLNISLFYFSACGRLISHRISHNVHTYEIRHMQYVADVTRKNDEVEIQIVAQCTNSSLANFFKKLEIIRSFEDFNHDIITFHYIWPGWVINIGEALGYIFPETPTMILQLEPTAEHHDCYFNLSYVYRQPVVVDLTKRATSGVWNLHVTGMLSWKETRQKCHDLGMALVQLEQEEEFFNEREVLAQELPRQRTNNIRRIIFLGMMVSFSHFY